MSDGRTDLTDDQMATVVITLAVLAIYGGFALLGWYSVPAGCATETRHRFLFAILFGGVVGRLFCDVLQWIARRIA